MRAAFMAAALCALAVATPGAGERPGVKSCARSVALACDCADGDCLTCASSSASRCLHWPLTSRKASYQGVVSPGAVAPSVLVFNRKRHMFERGVSASAVSASTPAAAPNSHNEYANKCSRRVERENHSSGQAVAGQGRNGRNSGSFGFSTFYW